MQEVLCDDSEDELRQIIPKRLSSTPEVYPTHWRAITIRHFAVCTSDCYADYCRLSVILLDKEIVSAVRQGDLLNQSFADGAGLSLNHNNSLNSPEPALS
jgi:hypothetical protein